jgi:hypothetical protein
MRLNVSFITTRAANFPPAALKYGNVLKIFRPNPRLQRAQPAQTHHTRKREGRLCLYPITSIVAVLRMRAILAPAFKST